MMTSNPGIALVALGFAFLAALGGGALSGMLIGGKDIPRPLAAMMGAFFGPLAGFLGTIVGLGLSLVFFRGA